MSRDRGDRYRLVVIAQGPGSFGDVLAGHRAVIPEDAQPNDMGRVPVYLIPAAPHYLATDRLMGMQEDGAPWPE